MLYKEDMDVYQLVCLDSLLKPDSPARVIEAFVEGLDVYEFGVKEPKEEGRPGYNPKSMFKLYIYGYMCGLRSSRSLEHQCEVNVEAMYLMRNAKPDHRTIADFRKNNVDALQKIFLIFLAKLSKGKDWGFTSIDGTKVRACNGKERNFTKAKLDERIKRQMNDIAEYLREMDLLDEKETKEEKAAKIEAEKEELQKKIDDKERRSAEYQDLRDRMEREGVSQCSLTDPDSRLMKSGEGFVVSYNVQPAVDSDTDLIRDFLVTNQPTDHGLIAPTMENIRKGSGDEILETVADMGYQKSEDMAICLENGIVPHVVLPKGKDDFLVEFPYEESDDVNPESTKPEDIKKCLRAGVIPDVYADYLSDIKVVRKNILVHDGGYVNSASPYATKEEMIARAEEGYFVRDPETETVYCPAGQPLRKKCVKRNGAIRFYNKKACSGCKYKDKCINGNDKRITENGKCTTGKAKWKEIDFSKDMLEKEAQGFNSDSGEDAPRAKLVVRRNKYKHETVRVVRMHLKPDRRKTDQRKCISEHVFGTLKRSRDSGYFLLKGKQKVTGEFALMSLGYDLKRGLNMLGFEEMMRLMQAE